MNTAPFNYKIFLQVTLIVSILIAIAGFLTDFSNTQKYGGIDLRDRVVGARVSSELKKDPYFFKWNNEFSDRYLDPLDNGAVPIYTRLTVTPAVLMFQSLFSNFPYQTQHYFWFFVQWACLLGSIYLLSKTISTDSEDKKKIWILGLLAISGSMFWRLHVERGQIYIFYVFLFCLAFYLYNKYQNNILSGLILGYLISLRPTFIFAIIPFLIYKKFKFVSIITVGVLMSVLLSSLVTPTPLWKSYYQSIQIQTSLSMDETINYRPIGEDIVEGINLRNYLSVPGEDSSLFRIFRGVFNKWFSSTTFFLLLALFMTAITTLIIKIKIHQVSIVQLFFLGASLSFFSEFFIAAPRWPYANVIWLIPLSLMITDMKKNTQSRYVFLSYVLALLGIISYLGFSLIPHFTFVGDVAIPISVFIFTLTSILQISAKNVSSATQ